MSLLEKVRLATIFGTFQSTLTNFRYVTKKWKENAEEERLLGVSLTGIMDNKILNGDEPDILPNLLEKLRLLVVETNKIWAKKLGIPQSVATTTVKPSGTVSQLTDAASGIHARHNPFYIRRVRADKKDPMARMMAEMGFPVEDDVTKPNDNYVFSFPQKAPTGSIYRDDRTAVEQLNFWKIYKDNWTEHNPSVTISVKEDEWMGVGAWVYDNFDEVGGVSFLPYSDHIYRQAPYEDITEEEYNDLIVCIPKDVDWSKLSEYEIEDTTTGTQELACSSGICEIVDIGGV